MPLLNLKEADRDRYIYRIMKPKYVYALFQDRENVLVAPKKWDDPFENLVLSAPVQLSSGEMGEFGFRHDFYGQCWTLSRASDAMWRIYSPQKTGIRVRTTIGKLLGGLSNALGHGAAYKAHLGKVEYKRERDLKAICEEGVELTPDATGVAKTLLLKRKAFRHENEVRLLLLSDGDDAISDGMFRYPIEPAVMIDQLMMDPRLTANEATEMRVEIRKRTKFSGPVKRSLLYAPPKEFVTRLRGLNGLAP
jgi:hypothetical protein